MWILSFLNNNNTWLQGLLGLVQMPLWTSRYCLIYSITRKNRVKKMKNWRRKHNSAAVLWLLCVEKSSRILAWTSRIVACRHNNPHYETSSYVKNEITYMLHCTVRQKYEWQIMPLQCCFPLKLGVERNCFAFQTKYPLYWKTHFAYRND